eukprot:2028875-Amphidinium_carterae.1
MTALSFNGLHTAGAIECLDHSSINILHNSRVEQTFKAFALDSQCGFVRIFTFGSSMHMDQDQ